MKRRLFLRNTLAGSVALTAFNAGLLTTGTVFAVTEDFKAKSDKVTSIVGSAVKGTFKFKAPEIAENGAVVPLTVDASNMQNVSNISILALKNHTPLSASFDLGEGAIGFVSVRIKMIGTSPVVALVTADGQVSAVEKEVRVTVGGCGG